MKTVPVTRATLLESVRDYLLNLEESGIDGIPEIPALSAAEPVTALPRPAAAPRPPGAAPAAAVTVPDEVHETLEKIRKSIGDCQRCKLGKSRRNLVFGVGNPRARLVFVGEGPGADEDQQGEPFVGEAGRMLNRLIAAMGLKREDVYICNVVKCRPPANRDPEPEEIEACSSFLLRQIRSVNPEVIVGLGKFASHTLLETKEPISRLRGKFRDFHGIPLMPTYHPSYLLHRQGEGNMSAFWDVWDDMTQVLRMLKLPVPEKNRRK